MYVVLIDIMQLVMVVGVFYDLVIDDLLSLFVKGFGNMMLYGFFEMFCDDICNGKLLEVLWIILLFVYSEYLGLLSFVQGGWYVQVVFDVLMVNLEVWSKIVLLVNYDENDGFFDYMLLLVVLLCNFDGMFVGGYMLLVVDVVVEYYDFMLVMLSQLVVDGCLYGLGLCVLMWIVLLWSCGGWVNLQVFDYMLMLCFFEKCFGVVELQISVYCCVVCGDLMSVFNFCMLNNELLLMFVGCMMKSQVDVLSVVQ